MMCRGFGESLKRFGKQVQGAMPIVGLFSRLAAPDGGGFDEQVWRLIEGLRHSPEHSQAVSGSPVTARKHFSSVTGRYCMQTYPEYCRAKLDEGSIKLNCAAADLQAAKGPVCQPSSSWATCYCAMLKQILCAYVCASGRHRCDACRLGLGRLCFS